MGGYRRQQCVGSLVTLIGRVDVNLLHEHEREVQGREFDPETVGL